MSGIPFKDEYQKYFSELIVVIQARLSSSRLPKKVLEKIGEASILEHIFARLNCIFPKEQIYFAIPEMETELETYLQSKNWNYQLGSLEDVRSRFLRIAKNTNAKGIIRYTGDNPFVDLNHLGHLVEVWIHSRMNSKTYDLISFVGLPLGMGTELFSFHALSQTKFAEERHKEHVSLHIKENPEEFSILRIPYELNSASQKIRLTIDQKEDLEQCRIIFEKLAHENPFFGVKEVLELYESKPEIFTKNYFVEQLKFSVPNPITKFVQRILYLFGDPKVYSSGHFERGKLLRNYFFSIGHFVELVNFSEREQFLKNAYDWIVVDSRDESFATDNPAKVLFIDHFGPSQVGATKYFALPHPTLPEFSLEQAIVSPLQFLNPSFQKNFILLYLGSLEEKWMQVLLKKIPISEKVLIISAKIPEPSETAMKRVSKPEYIRLIQNAKLVISYFGLTTIECMLLGIPVANLGISKVHEELGIDLEKRFGIPYSGDFSKLESLDSIDIADLIARNQKQDANLSQTGFRKLQELVAGVQ